MFCFFPVRRYYNPGKRNKKSDKSKGTEKKNYNLLIFAFEILNFIQVIDESRRMGEILGNLRLKDWYRIWITITNKSIITWRNVGKQLSVQAVNNLFGVFTEGKGGEIRNRRQHHRNLQVINRNSAVTGRGESRNFFNPSGSGGTKRVRHRLLCWH